MRGEGVGASLDGVGGAPFPLHTVHVCVCKRERQTDREGGDDGGGGGWRGGG